MVQTLRAFSFTFSIAAASFATLACSSPTVSPTDTGASRADGSVAPTDASRPDGTAPDASAPDAPPSNTCTCAGDEGCVTVVVTRASDDTKFPWKMFGAPADGTGTLIVSAYNFTSKTTAQQRVPSAVFTDSNARYTIELGCVTAGSNLVNAYLDDNTSMPATVGFDTVQSSDYIDSCAYPRSQKFTVVAGEKKEIPLELGGSCD